jgi:translation elongation factor EF-Ts
MVEINCETDFVARTDDFGLRAEVAMQVAATNPGRISGSDPSNNGNDGDRRCSITVIHPRSK